VASPKEKQGKAVVDQFENSLRYRTGSGPGSPSGQTALGGGCDRIKHSRIFSVRLKKWRIEEAVPFSWRFVKMTMRAPSTKSHEA
jgi:hypothetical protein